MAMEHFKHNGRLYWVMDELYSDNWHIESEPLKPFAEIKEFDNADAAWDYYQEMAKGARLTGRGNGVTETREDQNFYYFINNKDGSKIWTVKKRHKERMESYDMTYSEACKFLKQLKARLEAQEQPQLF